MQIRGRGNAFATGVGNWAVSTLWNQVSPIALDKIKWKFYFVFAAFSKFSLCLEHWPFPFFSLFFFFLFLTSGLDLFVSLPVIYFFFQETKQKSLEEIDILFGGRALGTLPEDVTSKPTAEEREHAGETGIMMGRVDDSRV